MHRQAMRKNSNRAKDAPKRESAKARELEFARGWETLEADYQRLQSDWGSLAQQLGLHSSSRAF